MFVVKVSPIILLILLEFKSVDLFYYQYQFYIQ